MSEEGRYTTSLWRILKIPVLTGGLDGIGNSRDRVVAGTEGEGEGWKEKFRIGDKLESMEFMSFKICKV